MSSDGVLNGRVEVAIRHFLQPQKHAGRVKGDICEPLFEIVVLVEKFSLAHRELAVGQALQSNVKDQSIPFWV